MKLRFVAREDILATVPGAPVALGQHVARVNRSHVPQKDGGPVLIPALQEPHEVDDETTPAPIVDQWKRLAMHGDVWAADEATARACGPSVEFVHPVFAAGVWTRPDDAPTPAAPSVSQQLSTASETPTDSTTPSSSQPKKERAKS